MYAGTCLHFSRSHGLSVLILHTSPDSRTPKVKTYCWYQEKEKWGPCRNAKRAASLAKSANRSVQTCWCSHLPGWGCGNEHLYRRTGFISMDGQGELPLGFAIGVTCACQKTSPQNWSSDTQTRLGVCRLVLWGLQRRPHGISLGDCMGSHSLTT